MSTLNNRIRVLEQKINQLTTQINNLKSNPPTPRPQPETHIGQSDLGHFGNPIPSPGTGLGRFHGRPAGHIYNDAEAKVPEWGTQPVTPTTGYNRHSHSEFSGGALDVHTLKLVEYEYFLPTISSGVEDAMNPTILDSKGNPLNKHCQSYWQYPPKINKEQNPTTKEFVEKIGFLDIEFDRASRKWVSGTCKYIDVETVNFAQYAWYDEFDIEVPGGTAGAVRRIKLDDNGKEMKSPLLVMPIADTVEKRNDALNPTNVWWDKSAKCWRFYAVFKPEEEE